ncbi:hypothetical protein CPB84DRAFT_1659691, partial [Gymnopilus junonius]
SIIDSSPCHKGKMGPHLTLGPFRFANHDCQPNCQILPIPDSIAYALCSIRPIQAGESLMVNYSIDGSYFQGKTCGCAMCNLTAPP